MKSSLQRRPVWRLALVAVLAVSFVIAMNSGTPFATTQISTDADEGDKMTFTVNLGVAPNGYSIRYTFKTEDGTAEAGKDYTARTGKVVFASGESTKTVDVWTSTDQIEEDDEYFTLKLYNIEAKGFSAAHSGWVSFRNQLYGVPNEQSLNGEIKDVAP